MFLPGSLKHSIFSTNVYSLCNMYDRCCRIKRYNSSLVSRMKMQIHLYKNMSLQRDMLFQLIVVFIYSLFSFFFLLYFRDFMHASKWCFLLWFTLYSASCESIERRNLQVCIRWTNLSTLLMISDQNLLRSF